MRAVSAKALYILLLSTLLRLQRDNHLHKKPRVPLRSTLGYVLLRLQRVLVNVFSASE